MKTISIILVLLLCFSQFIFADSTQNLPFEMDWKETIVISVSVGILVGSMWSLAAYFSPQLPPSQKESIIYTGIGIGILAGIFTYLANKSENR